MNARTTTGRRMTKDQRIAALFEALCKISAQTKGYDEFSFVGSLHAVAHGAVSEEMKFRAALNAREGGKS